MLVRELLFRMGFSATAATAQAKRFDGVIAGVRNRLAALPAVALAAATAAAYSATRIADEYQGLSDSLKLVTNGAQEFLTAQRENYRIAQETYTSLDATTGLFTSLARPAKRYGYELSEVLQVTQNILKVSKIGAKGNPASQQAALFQLQQGLESGTLRGEELNSVLEQAPRLADMIAEGMGIARERLREVAAQGQITTQQIFDALLKQTGNIDAQFAMVKRKGVDAWQQVKTAIFRVVGELSQSEGFMTGIVAIFDQLRDTITSPDFRLALKALIAGFTALVGIAALMVKGIIALLSWLQRLVDKLGGWARVTKILVAALSALGIVMGAKMIASVVALIGQLGLLFTAQYAAASAAGVLATALNAIPLMLLITLLALVLEDLWNFVQGNESVIGTLKARWTSFDVFFTDMVNGWLKVWQTFINEVIRQINWFTNLKIPELKLNVESVKKGFADAQKFLGNVGDRAMNIGAGLSMNSAGASLAKHAMSPITNNFSPNISVTVPPGTQKEQAEFTAKLVRDEVEKSHARHYRKALNDLPRTE